MFEVDPHPNFPPEEGRYLRGDCRSPVATVLHGDADEIPGGPEALVPHPFLFFAVPVGFVDLVPTNRGN